MKNCVYCSSKDIVKNGFYKIKLGRPVLRFKCKDCCKSFRSLYSTTKRENRGRKRNYINIQFQNKYSYILIDLISYYSYRKKLSFYKAATYLTGKSRTTLRRYLSIGSFEIDEELIIFVFKKVKFELEQDNYGKMTISIYRRLQTIANDIVKTSLGPPLAYVRKNTIIWNTKSSNYKEMIEELSKK
jgi:transposase-like protein